MPQVVEAVSTTLSRWRHGFKPIGTTNVNPQVSAIVLWRFGSLNTIQSPNIPSEVVCSGSQQRPSTVARRRGAYTGGPDDPSTRRQPDEKPERSSSTASAVQLAP